MYSLNNQDFKIETENIISQVFIDLEPMRPCFTEEIKNRCILFPCYVELNQSLQTNNWGLLSAITDSATAIGDSGCYISYLAWDGDLGNTNAFIPTSNLMNAFGYESGGMMCAQLDMGMGWEYIVFSNSAKWGVIVDQYEHFAVIGGCNDFMESFYQLFPDVENQVYLFLEFLESRRKPKTDRLTLEWLSPLLVHIYGYEKAKSLLIETKLMRFLEVSGNLKSK
jgi:hypothetical protein